MLDFRLVSLSLLQHAPLRTSAAALHGYSLNKTVRFVTGNSCFPIMFAYILQIFLPSGSANNIFIIRSLILNSFFLSI